MKLLFLFFGVGLGYDLILKGSERQCYGEELSINTLLVCEIKFKDPRTAQFFSVFAYDKVQNVLHENHQIREDKFSFTTTLSGPYTICVENKGHGVSILSLKIFTGLAARDFTSAPSTKDFKESERRLNKIKEAVQEIHKDLQNIKERDLEMTNTNETIQNRIIFYSVITLFLLIALAILQTMYLKKYMKFKKMI